MNRFIEHPCFSNIEIYEKQEQEFFTPSTESKGLYINTFDVYVVFTERLYKGKNIAKHYTEKGEFLGFSEWRKESKTWEKINESRLAELDKLFFKNNQYAKI